MGAIFYRPAGPFTGIRSRRLRSQNFCSMQWHPMKTQATNISDRFSEYYQTWKYDQKSTIRKSPLLSDFHKPSETNSSYYQNVTKRSENLRYDQNFSDGIYTSDAPAPGATRSSRGTSGPCAASSSGCSPSRWSTCATTRRRPPPTRSQTSPARE